MSGVNGDKSRFNRQRKTKIARRARNYKLLVGLNEQSKSSAPALAASKKTVAA